jgi:Mannosyl-glycoprotein endo-beta-N-acetylglucosaminidase
MPVAAVVSLPAEARVESGRSTGPREASEVFAAALSRAQSGTQAPGTVAPAHTPLSGEEAASALSQAWQGVMGRPPTAKQLSVLTAQWSLETGGGRAMMNNNFGGLKGRSPEGLTVAYRTKEGYGATERSIVDHFRAYATPRAGAADYVHTLETRFPRAFAALRTGDPAAFAHALKSEGYYTGSEADYTRAVASLSERALDKGFGAIGQAGGNHAAVAVSTPDEPSLGAIDALQLADQMSRAAMQIASAEARREEDT